MQWIKQHRERLQSVRTLVFDWDGTLADSIENIVECMQLAATTAGLPSPEKQAVRDIIGLGLGEAVDQLFPKLTTVAQSAVVDAYREHYLSPQYQEVRLFNGVVELLDRLDSAGYLLAVATGKSRRGLDRALAETGLKSCFVATCTVDECHSKPHPQMLHDIADQTGVATQQMLMIGDGVMDIQMATNAEVMAMGVCTGAGEQDELLAQGALGCLESVGRLSFMTGPGEWATA